MSLTAERLISLILLLSFIQANGQHKQKLHIEKEPAWITVTNVDYANNQLDNEAEEGAVNLVFEKQIFIERQSVFIKRSIRLLSTAGVQNYSEISIDFDPLYQTIALHKIEVLRDGRRINKLHLSKIKTVQQEKELNSFIYNGTSTAMVFLEDVQKDDVIEYSYTIKGFNPIFKGRFSNVLETNFSVPVYQIYYKLLSSTNRHLQCKNSNTDVKPLITTVDTLASYEWKLNNIPAFRAQDHLPSWYDPYATVMISDFLNWKEVNDWALSLFPSNVAFSSALLNKIHEIKLHHNDPYNQTAAALRFVQDEIRYLGIEMGENSHRPHSPDQILKQRFGDCKDKSYLLCTLLKGLGIEAHPVLINTTYKGTIREWLPTPTAFDHTTVRVKIDNRFYWFDPTLSFQRGPIHTISFPDYQAGLVVTDTTVQITTIPCLTKGTVHVKERFDIKDMSGGVKLTVTSHYSGSFADDTRSEFKNNSRYEMSKTYQDFYAGYFKNIKADSLTTQDEEKTGSFTTIEYYTIDSLWGPYAYMKKASFEPFVINGVMTKPTHEKRTMPFRLKYPAHYKEQVEINLPEIWNAKQSSDQTETSAFKLTTDFSCTGKQVLLNYDYVALKDHIMPDEADSYLRNMKKAETEIGYELTHTTEIDTAPAFTGKSSGYGFLYVALGLCVFITYNIRRQNKINRY